MVVKNERFWATADSGLPNPGCAGVRTSAMAMSEQLRKDQIPETETGLPGGAVHRQQSGQGVWGSIRCWPEPNFLKVNCEDSAGIIQRLAPVPAGFACRPGTRAITIRWQSTAFAQGYGEPGRPYVAVLRRSPGPARIKTALPSALPEHIVRTPCYAMKWC